MNYIELINNFWKKDMEFNFSDRETSLYFYLLNVSNSISWKNPFGLSNAMTTAKFGWGKSSFDNAKNRLKLAGLIDFKAGDGRGIIYQYEIKGIKKVYQKNTLSDTLSERKSSTSININKNKTKSKTNNRAETKVSDEKDVFVNGVEKKEILTGGAGYFNQLKSVWFVFYRGKFPVNPTFTAIDGSKLKSIEQKLRSKCKEFDSEWSEETAKELMAQLLTVAYSEKWLRENFSMANIDSQFNQIIVKSLKTTHGAKAAENAFAGW